MLVSKNTLISGDYRRADIDYVGESFPVLNLLKSFGEMILQSNCYLNTKVSRRKSKQLLIQTSDQTALRLYTFDEMARKGGEQSSECLVEDIYLRHKRLQMTRRHKLCWPTQTRMKDARAVWIGRHANHSRSGSVEWRVGCSDLRDVFEQGRWEQRGVWRGWQ